MVSRRILLIGGGAVVIGASAVCSGVRHMGSMSDYATAIAIATATATQRAPMPTAPQAADLIRFASLAANSHNTQAWAFRVTDNAITFLPDFSRVTPVVDPDNQHLFVSLGCAAENLSVAAASRGLPGEMGIDPVASELRWTHGTGAAKDTALSDAIPQRQSTRGMYDGSILTPAEPGLLAGAARLPGVDLILITDPRLTGQLTDLIASGNTAQIANPAFLTELKHWMRFNPRQALARASGHHPATRRRL